MNYALTTQGIGIPKYKSNGIKNHKSTYSFEETKFAPVLTMTAERDNAADIMILIEIASVLRIPISVQNKANGGRPYIELTSAFLIRTELNS